MNKYFFIILVTVICLLQGCDKEEPIIKNVMKDGVEIVVPTKVRYYDSEEEFIHNVSFSFHREYDLKMVEEVEYTFGEQYVVTGYDQRYNGVWEKAKFGDWISSYGLDASDTYYVCTTVVTKYLNIPPQGLMIVPKLGIELMGYCPGIDPKTFLVDYATERDASILLTGARTIGYDSDGNSISISVPSFFNNNTTNLTWKFLIQTDGWD